MTKFGGWKTVQYEVIGVGRHSETLEPMVIYRPLNGDAGLWLRPHAMFFGSLLHEGREVLRFSPCEAA